MAQKAKHTTSNGCDALPKEVFAYNDDVTKEIVAEIRRERGVDVSDSKWKVIDSFGQVVST